MAKREWTENERKLVVYMSVCGVTLRDMAKTLRVRPEVFRRDFKEELKDATVKHNAAVVEALHKNAMMGNVAAQIFWCKAKLGWREKVEHLGEDGKALIPQINIQVAGVLPVTKRVVKVVEAGDGSKAEGE
jgi:hypothetical protein